MASEITIDASEFFTLAGKAQNAGPVIVDELRGAMVRATAQVEHDAKAEVAYDLGTLRRSITSRIGVPTSYVGSNLPYARVVEEGRKPGEPIVKQIQPKKPGGKPRRVVVYENMPPRGALLDWMRRHGMPLKAEFALRVKIARDGIAARPYLRPALEQNRTAINREFQVAVDRATRRLLD